MELKPDWEAAEEVLVRTQSTEELGFSFTAVPRFSIAEPHVANEESHQNISTLDSTRLESSELDHIVSQQGGNYIDHAAISRDDLEHSAGIDTDTSLNDQDSVIYQRQLPAGNNSDFTAPWRRESIGALKEDIQNCKWHQDTVARPLLLLRLLDHRLPLDDQTRHHHLLVVVNDQIDESTARMQRIRLLKQYGFVKKELNWPDVISIAHNLHADGYIKQHEMEQMKDGSQSRREAIDTLLKIVLRNPSTVSAFTRILESKRHLLYIAERFNKTKISAEEMERFQFQEGTLQQQSIYLEPSQKFHLSDSDVDILIHNLLEEEEVIDQISDILLSNFYISIHDHSKINDCAYFVKIHRLLDLMKKCPDSALDIFIEVLTENNLQHVLDSLERNQMVNIKRKYSSCDDESPPAKKHMKIDHNQKISTSDAVEKIASGLRNAATKQMLRNKAIQHLDLEFNEAFSGSLGLMLSFKVGEPSQKLK